MIEASFGSGSRGAAVSGAYQYDTGQRLRMYGLPSPQELAERDDFLAGDVVTVQAQYAFAGDSQTETRIALWDDDLCAWTAAVPDVYLTEHDDVHVYIYVGYGQTDEAMRTKTMYEAVFRPSSRPTPGNIVTPSQLNAWDALAQEVNLAITNVNTAGSNANAAAQEAREAGQKLDRMTVSASTLDPGAEATVELSEAGGRKHVAFGIPQGPRGEQGVPGVFSINGKEVTNEAEVTLTPQDIGAISVGTQMSKVVKAEFDLAYALQSDGWYACTAEADVLETDHVIADIDFSDQQASFASDLRDAYALIARMDVTANGKITAYFTGDPSKSVPSVAYIPVKLLIV